jgi:hypothetical protein
VFQPSEGKERICFSLDPAEWHAHGSERLWAESAGDAAGAFRLLNSPFFVRGVSHLDIVKAVRQDDVGGMQFERIIEHSGHSTYMILVVPGSREFPRYWSELQQLGCTYESMEIEISLGRRALYSVDVPGATDINAVYSILEDGERSEIWMFQEGHLGHELRK